MPQASNIIILRAAYNRHAIAVDYHLKLCSYMHLLLMNDVIL